MVNNRNKYPVVFYSVTLRVYEILEDILMHNADPSPICISKEKPKKKKMHWCSHQDPQCHVFLTYSVIGLLILQPFQIFDCYKLCTKRVTVYLSSLKRVHSRVFKLSIYHTRFLDTPKKCDMNRGLWSRAELSFIWNKALYEIKHFQLSFQVKFSD